MIGDWFDSLYVEEWDGCEVPGLQEGVVNLKYGYLRLLEESEDSNVIYFEINEFTPYDTDDGGLVIDDPDPEYYPYRGYKDGSTVYIVIDWWDTLEYNAMSWEDFLYELSLRVEEGIPVSFTLNEGALLVVCEFNIPETY